MREVRIESPARMKSWRGTGGGAGGFESAHPKAVAGDVPRLREVIEASVRGFQAEDYSPPKSKAH